MTCPYLKTDAQLIQDLGKELGTNSLPVVTKFHVTFIGRRHINFSACFEPLWSQDLLFSGVCELWLHCYLLALSLSWLPSQPTLIFSDLSLYIAEQNFHSLWLSYCIQLVKLRKNSQQLQFSILSVTQVSIAMINPSFKTK